MESILRNFHSAWRRQSTKRQWLSKGDSEGTIEIQGSDWQNCSKDNYTKMGLMDEWLHKSIIEGKKHGNLFGVC